MLEVFKKKTYLLFNNVKLQHQIQSCNGCFQSPLKIEFVKCPIEKANLKKLGNAGLFKEKNFTPCYKQNVK